MHLVAQRDLGEPLVRDRARPAGDHEPQRAAVDVRQRRTVHVPDEQAVPLDGLGDRHAARQRLLAGIAREVLIGAGVGRVDSRGFHARRLEHLHQRDAAPLGAARAAVGPLVAARLWREERATIAAAFEHHPLRGDGRLEALLQIAQRDLERLVDLAVDAERPGIGIASLGRWHAVVADEEARGRRRLVVEQVLGRLSDERLVAEHHEALVLAGKVERRGALALGILRERGGDEARRHAGREHDRPADRGGERRIAGAFQEAAARGVRAPAEHVGIGPLGIRAIELFEAAFALRHCPPSLFRIWIFVQIAKQDYEGVAQIPQCAGAGNPKRRVDLTAARFPRICTAVSRTRRSR